MISDEMIVNVALWISLFWAGFEFGYWLRKFRETDE